MEPTRVFLKGPESLSVEWQPIFGQVIWDFIFVTVNRTEFGIQKESFDVIGFDRYKMVCAYHSRTSSISITHIQEKTEFKVLYMSYKALHNITPLYSS